MNSELRILLMLLAVCITHIGSAQSEKISRHASANFGYGKLLISGEVLGDIFSFSLTLPKEERKFLEFEGRFLDYVLDQPVRNAQDSIVSGSEEEIESFAIRTKYGVRLLSEKWIEPQFLPYMSAYRNERAYVPYHVNRVPLDAEKLVSDWVLSSGRTSGLKNNIRLRAIVNRIIRPDFQKSLS